MGIEENNDEIFFFFVEKNDERFNPTKTRD